jgi:hypothetical protein
MNYSVKVIYGKEQVNKFLKRETFTRDENELHIKTYFFKTELERTAFCQGIDEAVGWTECLRLNSEE